MFKKISFYIVTLFFIGTFSGLASAHFGMVIPSDNMVMQGESRKVSLTFSFSHPFEGAGMDLAKPEGCGVVKGGIRENILGTLKETRVMGHPAWRSDYQIKRPGVYGFFMVPEPYWEPAEDSYIVHYTKTFVAAFGEEAGWDVPFGLKTEIVPLTRPFGLYAGNLFQGMVLKDGKPVPNAEVEIEYYNRDKRAVAPNDYFITQVIRADPNGIFTYAAPKAGWWGFAGLSSSDHKVKYGGVEKEVELGAVLWVRFHDWKKR